MIERDDFKAACGAPDAGFDRALDDALRRIRAKEAQPVMKRKLSVGLLVAIIAILALTGAALAVGLNLFELFGKYDKRLSQIAEKTRLETGTPAKIETDEIGAVHAAFDSAYYDGQTLIAAYTVENHSRVERFEPTDEWLREAVPRDAPPSLAHWDGSDSAILDELEQAVRQGKPFGFVHYTLEPNDHCTTEDGVDLPPLTENRNVTPDGKLCGLREFETPLPQAAQNRDSLELHMPLKLFTAYVYYDGERTYEEYENRDAGEITATVTRTESVTRRFVGEGSCNGVPVRVEARASAVHVALSVAADGEAFPDPKALYPESNDVWYEPWLEDENGMPMNPEEIDVHADGMTAGFTGSGRLPERLRLMIDIAREGDWDGIAVTSDPVILTPVE